MTKRPVHRGDSAAGARWLALAGASLVFLVVMFGTTMPTPLYSLYREQLSLSQMAVTIIYAAYAVGVIGALLLAGSWSDQLGRRRILFAALASAAASGLIFLSEASLTTLLLGRVLSGMSAGLATGTATVLIIELAPPARRQAATLLATAVNTGGLGLGPLAAGVLAQYAAWPLHLVFVVHLLLIGLAVLTLRWVPETVSIARPARLRPQRLDIPPAVRAVFVPAAVAGFAGFALLGLFAAVISGFLIEVLALPSLALAGLVVMLAFAASMLGQLALEWVPRHLALIGGCVVLAVAAAFVTLGLWQASLFLLLASAVLSGLGHGLSFRAGLIDVTLAAPADRRAEITSSLFVVLYVALSIPVIGVGIGADLFGLRRAGVGFSLAVLLLALVALALVWRRRGSREPQSS